MKNKLLGLLFCGFFSVGLLGMESGESNTSFFLKKTIPVLALTGVGLYTTKRVIEYARETKDIAPLVILLGIDGILTYGVYKILTEDI